MVFLNTLVTPRCSSVLSTYNVFLSACITLLQLQTIQSFTPFPFQRVFTTSATRPHGTRLYVARETDTFACSVVKRISRKEAHTVMDESILPVNRYSDRQRSGRDAQGLQGNKAVAATDPCMEFTYGEFPLSSMDELIDLGLSYLPPGKKDTVTMVDLGSGCGRLVFYAALTRGDEEVPWTVHGIEVADLLHDEALRASLNGIDSGWFQNQNSPDSNGNNFVLHKGLAGEFASILQQCDVVFAYSTVWDSIGFSEQISAMIIGQQWNELISKSCRKGTVVITTDRAMDPGFGFRIVERRDVDNREVVIGSTGYIHVLE